MEKRKQYNLSVLTRKKVHLKGRQNTMIAIIGGGPAGLSAAVNIIARNEKAVIFTNGQEKSALYKAALVENHLGMPGMSGKDLISVFTSHAEALGAEFVDGNVTQVLAMGNYFMINCSGKIHKADAVIFASGIVKKPSIKGEAEFLGRGVSYCASCDAMLYRNKSVVVIGETPEAEEEANLLSEICSSVSYISPHGKPEKLSSAVTLRQGKITEIFGGEYAEGVIIDDSGRKSELLCDGVFVIKESAPAQSLIAGLIIENGAIKTNRQAQTSILGIFACGDCTGAPYQLSKAIGEGLIAGQNAAKYAAGGNA